MCKQIVKTCIEFPINMPDKNPSQFLTHPIAKSVMMGKRLLFAFELGHLAHPRNKNSCITTSASETSQ